MADLLLARQTDILEANRQDMRTAEEEGLSGPNLSRLKLNAEKLKTLHDGLKQIGDVAKTMVGQTLKRVQVAEGLELVQQSVPIGVLLVIFESRPDCLPQVKIEFTETIYYSRNNMWSRVRLAILFAPNRMQMCTFTTQC